jgi:hypothetical protein
LIALDYGILFANALLKQAFQYIAPRTLVSTTVRIAAVFLAISLFKTFTAPNTSQATYPLSVAHLNNATLSFETVILLTSKPAFKQKPLVFFNLPSYENGILRASIHGPPEAAGLLEASPLMIEANAPKRKGHTAAIMRIVDKGFSTALIFEEKVGVNARFREELYWVQRALHKLKGYWDEPDSVIPIGSQPNYSPYYRMPPSVDTQIYDFPFEKLVTGKGIGRTKESREGVGEWDIIFMGDCKEKFDEEAQMKLRSQNKEKTPWRRMDWVPEAEETSDLWVPELTDADYEYARKLREKKRESGAVGEKEMLGQGLRRSDGVGDVCILGYAVSRRGALKLQKHFGASDPGLGTQDLLARFCGASESVCFVLGEGLVRERKQT